MEINKIHKGDCLDIMAEMPDNFVDCIVTDPPYFMPAVHYNTRKNLKGTLPTWVLWTVGLNQYSKSLSEY